MDWEFRDPIFLLAAAAAPALLVLAVRSPSYLNFSSLALADGLPRSPKIYLAQLPALLQTLAFLLLVVALAGPRTPDASTRIQREGIAIVMVVDRSSSMNARDMVQEDSSVDRLQAVKSVFERFILGDQRAGVGRPDDLIGLVSFAGYADSMCPMTLDHGNLLTIAGDLEIVDQRSEDGTAIGEGLALAVERLRGAKAQSKVAILLTDGVNNAGAIAPRQAAEFAESQNVRVYCIGVGTKGMAQVPVRSPFSGRITLRPMPVEIDEDTLQEISKTTRGSYFRATDQDALAEIYREIDRLERTKIAETRYLQYTEHYGHFVVAGLLVLAVATLSGATFLRRLP